MLQFRSDRPVFHDFIWSEACEEHIYAEHKLTRYHFEAAFREATKASYHVRNGSEIVRGRCPDGRLIEMMFISRKGYITPKTGYPV